MNYSLPEMYSRCKGRESEWPSRGSLYESFMEYMNNLESEIKSESSELNLDKKISLNDKKIFIFGSMKSGTSLLLNLLDGHPQLACLPVDAHLLKHYNNNDKDKKDFYDLIHKLWFRKLISPTGREPFLVFGDSRKSYLKFSFYLREMLNCDLSNFNSFNIAASSYVNASSFFEGKDNLIPVEKTPENEYKFDLISTNFPNSKYLHIIRDPIVNYISLKRNAKNLNYSFHPGVAINGIIRSLYAAKINSELDDKNYLVIRYEDLTSNLESFSTKITDHLQISKSKSLLTPSILGKQVKSNSMYSNLQNKSNVYSRNLKEDREKSLKQFSEQDVEVFRSLSLEAITLIREFDYEI